MNDLTQIKMSETDMTKMSSGRVVHAMSSGYNTLITIPSSKRRGSILLLQIDFVVCHSHLQTKAV